MSFCAPSSAWSSVIDPLHEPPVALEVVVQLAQKAAVEQRLPVLADHWLIPPLGLNLPARDGIDRPAEDSRDERRRAIRGNRHLDLSRWRQQPRHTKRSEGMGEERSAGRGLRTMSSPWRSCNRSRVACTSSLFPSPPAHSLSCRRPAPSRTGSSIHSSLIGARGCHSLIHEPMSPNSSAALLNEWRTTASRFSWLPGSKTSRTRTCLAPAPRSPSSSARSPHNARETKSSASRSSSGSSNCRCALVKNGG